jgi:hypothetical protein
MENFGDCLEYDKQIEQDLFQTAKSYHFFIKLNHEPQNAILILA